MSDKIRAALAQLNPENDEHWTSEGLPRLDVMKDLVGEAVSRADITGAAKSFTRKTPNLEAESDATEEPETENAQASSEEDAPDTQKAPEPEPKEDPGVALEGDEAVEAELTAARKHYNKAQERLRQAQAAMDVVIRRREEKEAGRTDAHDIKAYQASQRQQRQSQAQRQKAMAEAIAATRTQY